MLAAVIAELNPFHNGHAYLFSRVRAEEAHVAVVMSGNFTQRGEPALYDKWTRTRAALLGGVDLVAELPLPQAVAGAKRFARGGVAAAAALGAEKLVFGSECGELSPLYRAAEAVEDPAVGEGIRRRMEAGVTFAAAREAAVRETYGPETAGILREPNNVLAVEYLLALRGTGIRPETFPRVGTAHDAAAPAGEYASASLLRKRVAAGERIDPYVPDVSVYAGAPVCLPAALEAPLLSRLRAFDRWDTLPECAEGIERRLYAASRRARTLEELYALAKTKRYTLARLRRLALCAYLGVTEEMSASPPPYVRLLGCTACGRALLHGVRGGIPVNASLSRLARTGGAAARLARLEAAADDQYALLQSPRGVCGRDWTEGLIRI